MPRQCRTAKCSSPKPGLKAATMTTSSTTRPPSWRKSETEKLICEPFQYDKWNFSPVKSSNCKPCPVDKPMFLCGSDNKTYSSLCRLDYHNCLHETKIKVSCEGFCPCNGELGGGLLQRRRRKAFPRRSAENHNSPPPDNCTLINLFGLTIHFVTEIPAEIKKAQHKSGDRANQLKAKYKKTIALDATFNKVRYRTL